MSQQTHVEHVEHEDEGHSVAGWVGVVTILVGILVGAVSMYLDILTGVWVAIGLVALGIVLWPVLKFAGFGPKHQ